MHTLINDGWLFAKLPCGSTRNDAEKASYTPVDLPHDWLIGQKDLYESADAWYRRFIDLPEHHDPVVIVRFDGVYMDCDVLLNGETVCTHAYGYTAFDADLTGKTRPGRNLLEVHIRHRSPNTRWYSGSGIYRDVYLDILPEDHLVPDGLYLAQEAGEPWNLRITAETSGSDGVPFTCTLRDREGKTITEASGTSSGHKINCTMKIRDARLWSPEDPYLYALSVCYAGQCLSRRIGLRSVSASADKGLLLNGKPVKIKGVCLHHDLGALGAAFHRKAARRQLQLMKNMGANAVRTSHNPPASAFLDLCDEMGILVADEAFDMWEEPKTEYDYARFFPEWHERDVASWIRRDRCHPSVILWSIGNEIYDMHADTRGTEVTKELARLVRLHDPDRHAPITFGCNYMQWEGGQRCAEYVDVVGYNYGEKLYREHHRKHPGWIIYGSETGSVLSSRGIYHFPVTQSILSENDRQCSALGNSNTSWGAESLTKIIIEDLRHPFSLGQFIWSGIDYIGEPTPYTTRCCYFGQADTACYPKDAYYLFRSFWQNEKMIHIGVSWDWNPGQRIDIPVMTNCREAELLLNGESLGRKRPDFSDPKNCLPVWTIPFVPGVLTARGYDGNGNLLREDCRYTPGNTDHFSLQSENDFLLSDGQDLAFVTVEALDRNGHPVENARDYVKISVSGGGCLIGTDNGDSTDEDSFRADCRRLFSGRLLLIIRSNGSHEDTTVRIRTKDGRDTSLVIPVLKAEPVHGVSHIQKAFDSPMPGTTPPRKLEIAACGSTELTGEHSECSFRYSVYPPDADAFIRWQVTNAAGIETPYATAEQRGEKVTVKAYADGAYYLRGLCGEDERCDFISQIEISATGMGSPAMDPYSYLSAGLYDIHEGDIGTGNEKGIAFSRDGESMAGFSRIDFGDTGTDTLTADIFALNGEPYDIELTAAAPDGTVVLRQVLRYQKPSIWNVYQPETWKLEKRLKGLLTLRFRMRDKVHMKGFVFEKQLKSYLCHEAGSADLIYGDQYERNGDRITGIGNNVTLTWNNMDFDGERKPILEINGRTGHAVNTICIRVKNEAGEETSSIAEFTREGEAIQCFTVPVPQGICSVSFVFLPGSDFDFHAFRFYRGITGQTAKNKL